MNKITISAPGKLMLFGEHAVVYARPCLVTAANQRMRVTIATTEKKTMLIDAPDVDVLGYEKSMEDIGSGDIPKAMMFVEKAVMCFIAKHPVSCGLQISVSSDFSANVGFGSSSASTVCVVKALAELSSQKFSLRQLFDISYRAVLEAQGSGSGFDVAASLFGGSLYFLTGGKTIESLKTSDIPLIVGYTGVKADTASLVREIGEKMKAQPERVNRIFDAIAKLVEDAKTKMIENDWERVGKLMDFNQEYLRDIGVSSEKLESLISAAKGAGAWGAKLSGAGGGDCMIAVAADNKKQAIEKAIEAVGGQVIHIASGAQGVRVEP